VRQLIRDYYGLDQSGERLFVGVGLHIVVGTDVAHKRIDMGIVTRLKFLQIEPIPHRLVNVIDRLLRWLERIWQIRVDPLIWKKR
jgi:hypothetical protein